MKHRFEKTGSIILIHFKSISVAVISVFSWWSIRGRFLSDVFFVTLNKADKDYSPTTMYHDYSINENLFHWQSQSTTAADSPTGQRYIHHRERGSKVQLFVREFKADRITGGAEAYTFLGTANYVKHSGSRPMNITWKLDRPIPAKFLKKTNKLVVG